MLDLVLGLPGKMRLPGATANKQLLRDAFPDCVRPALAVRGKHGFVLPVRRWMQGPLRPACEAALAVLQQHAAFEPAAVECVWQSFLGDPVGPGWSRAWLLVTLGHYLDRAAARTAGHSA
jgi:hypothetical protein